MVHNVVSVPVVVVTMSDILVECDKHHLESMSNVLRAHLPQRIHQHNFIHSYLHHYDKINKNREAITSDRWNMRFYAHRNGERANCTLITMNDNRDYLYCFTLQESGVELMECLQQTNRINWHNTPFSIFCDELLFEIVKEVARHKVAIDWLSAPVHYIMHIRKETVAALPLNNNLPDDLYVTPLDALEHAKIIDHHWHYKDQNSLSYIRQSIELNGGVGLFRRGQSQPICWIATCETFTPGFLYTVKAERGRGYSLLLAALELKRLVRKHQLDLYSFVLVNNEPSLALNRKLGFRPIGRLATLEKPMLATSGISKL